MHHVCVCVCLCECDDAGYLLSCMFVHSIRFKHFLLHMSSGMCCVELSVLPQSYENALIMFPPEALLVYCLSVVWDVCCASADLDDSADESNAEIKFHIISRLPKVSYYEQERFREKGGGMGRRREGENLNLRTLILKNGMLIALGPFGPV